MGSPWYKDLFPRTRLARSPDSQEEFTTTRGGKCLATSVGGTLTGLGADFIIVDDANKTDDAHSETSLAAVAEWYQGTLLSRLNEKMRGCIIVIQQRIHENDLVGLVLEEGGWTHLNLPAIADESQRIPTGPNSLFLRKSGSVLNEAHEPMQVYDSLRRAMGSSRFECQYQQRPAPPTGLIYKRDWFGRYDAVPARSSDHQIVQSWDTASSLSGTADYSVGTTWLKTENHCYLLDVIRQRFDYPTLRKRVVSYAQEYHAGAVLIEDSSAGQPLLQELRFYDFPAIGIRPEGAKRLRAETESPIVEAGRILLPREAAWVGAFLAEVLMFPNAKHDDQVDSMSQFLKWWRERRYVPEYPFLTPDR